MKYGLNISFEEPEFDLPKIQHEQPKLQITPIDSHEAKLQSQTHTVEITSDTTIDLKENTTTILNIKKDANILITNTVQASALYIMSEDTNITITHIHTPQEKSIHYTQSQVKNATIKINTCIISSPYTKHFVKNELCENATATTNIAYIAKNQDQLDIYTESNHKEKESTSNIITKGVVTDTSKALSRGLVKIEKNAAQSNGYEKQEALILSKDAQAFAIPNLEIHNQDVKCSHGSTIGHLDEEKIFYLQSKGLSKQEAQKLIISGFFHMFPQEIQEKIMEAI